MPPKREMHPRNVFRTPPDYTDLAIKYTNFRKVCKLELTGKVQIDYKNEDALRALTQTLLQEYFQLDDVQFAPGSLVPTLPLRVNYILWLEDLLNVLPKSELDEIRGIDIGCGSSCIYSLLGAKMNGWHMNGLESNALNQQYAKQNVERNKLSKLIEIFSQNNAEHIFRDFFECERSNREQQRYHFCLCNPPFYDSRLADPFHGNTRNLEKRTPPSNCHTGKAEELACDGGEVQFVQRIIEESLLFKDRVWIFTSMLGHKSSLTKILAILPTHNIDNFSTTEFCQGKTTRWAIAWTFEQCVSLKECKST